MLQGTSVSNEKLETVSTVHKIMISKIIPTITQSDNIIESYWLSEKVNRHL